VGDLPALPFAAVILAATYTAVVLAAAVILSAMELVR
jgi:hypothetical protein